MEKIAVVGLGYVGLPLALLAEEKGFDVIGIDLDKNKLARLNKKQPVIDDSDANKRLKKSRLLFTGDFSNVGGREIVIVCVPTPVDEKKMPDLSLVKNASISCAQKMKEDSLLIIESTINPGVCDEALIPLIEKETSHVVGKTLHLAHCPERINPGDSKWTVDNINRVVGADSAKGLSTAYEFYSKLIDARIKKMGSLKEAEAVKIVENTFRDVNIAFVNELAMSFSKIGINVNNVIEGAATKPFAFMPHYPGIGIGGHCIPVDPYYLIEYARGNGFDHEFLALARSINESMPIYSVSVLEQALIKQTKKGLDGAQVAVLGLSYKPNVGDDRESPAYKVISALKDRGAKVTSYDPYVTHATSSASLKKAIAGKDAAILVTAHEEFNNIQPSELAGISVFLDGRNALRKLEKALAAEGVYYVGI
jgi:nucleotide sugar dehydrogenase